MKNEIETIRAAIKGAFSLLSAIEQNPKRTYVISGDKGALIGSLGALKTIENQFEAIGAGGVEPLRKGGCLHQIQEPAAAPVVLPEFDLRTSYGARSAVAWYFTNVLQRHDFTKYINNTLAADFACSLAPALLAGVSAPAAHCETCNDHGAVGNFLTAEPCPDCTVPAIAAQADARDAMTPAQIEAGAKTIAGCMDYPWAHMPEQGRESMRECAKATIAAIAAAKEGAQGCSQHGQN